MKCPSAVLLCSVLMVVFRPQGPIPTWLHGRSALLSVSAQQVTPSVPPPASMGKYYCTQPSSLSTSCLLRILQSSIIGRALFNMRAVCSFVQPQYQPPLEYFAVFPSQAGYSSSCLVGRGQISSFFFSFLFLLLASFFTHKYHRLFPNSTTFTLQAYVKLHSSLTFSPELT